MEGTIAVLGVTGNVGSRLANALAAQGVKVRGVARNPEKFEGADIELVQADLSDPEAASRAVAGATVVYLTPMLGGPTPTEHEWTTSRNAVEACQANNVAHVVMHTAMHADRGDTGANILDDKTKIETLLADSGVPYTILRPAYFLQNLWGAKDYLDQGTLAMPFSGDRKVGLVDVGDIVTLAIAAINAGPQNRGFDLHIPGGTTFTHLAAAATAASGSNVAFHAFDGAKRDFVAGFPISEPHKDLFAGLMEYFDAKDYVGAPQDVAAFAPGFEYRTPEQFFSEEMYAAVEQAPAE